MFETEEKKFLHDLAGPLSVCTLIVDLMNQDLKHPNMNTLIKSLETLEIMIRDRRAILSKKMEKT